MDDTFLKYLPLATLAVTVIVGYARLQAAHKVHGVEIDRLRRDLEVAQVRSHQQEIQLATILESLKAIKLSLDRVVERLDRQS